MKVRVAVATAITGVLLAAYLMLSGAPPRVHFVAGAALVVAFWIPALLVDRPTDVWARRWRVLALVSLGVVTLDVGSTMTTGKKEFLDAPALFAVGIPAMIALLALHGLVVHRAARC